MKVKNVLYIFLFFNLFSLFGCTLVRLHEDFDIDENNIKKITREASLENIQVHVIWTNGKNSKNIDASKTGKKIIRDIMDAEQYFFDVNR